MPVEGDTEGRQFKTAEPEVVAEIMDNLDALPEARRQEMTAFLYRHVGPLPDPATFAAYGSTYTEAPREILAMAVRQQEHDIDMASRALSSEIGYRRETLIAATIGLLAIVASATVLGVTEHDVAAGVMAGTGGIVVAVGALLKGRDLFPKSDTPAAPTPPTVADAPRPSASRPRPGKPSKRGHR